MEKILVLYYSRGGSVSAMAQQVAQGIYQVDNCEAVMRTVPAVSTTAEATSPAIPDTGDIYAQASDLEQCDALILGSPTRFGSIAAPLKYFFDQTTPQWLNGALNGKPAAAFTSSSSLHGGQESTLLGMLLPLLHHGMLVSGVPYYGTQLANTSSGGTPYGASHVDHPAGCELSKEEEDFCRQLGKRIALMAQAMSQVKW